MAGMTIIKTENAPQAIGPYSQATVSEGFVFTAGQIGINPGTGAVVEGGVESQTGQVMENLRNILEAAGCDFSDVVKATVFVTDLGHFALVNSIYGEALGDNRPARSTVQVTALPLGAEVEIDMTARKINK